MSALRTWLDAAERALMLVCAAVLVAKIIHLNNLADTMLSDPLDLWIAGGVALLLFRAAGQPRAVTP